MMAVACVGDGGSLGGCVWVRVEERMADKSMSSSGMYV